MGRKRKTKELVLTITNGVFNTTINLLLWQIYYTGALFGKPQTAGSFYQAFYEANDALREFNAGTIRNACQTLFKKGLIFLTDDGKTAKISKAGLKRLKSKIPFYDEKREWDGKIYLVIYDIPEKKRNQRNIFRDYLLKKLGCGMLQASVWLTPYNPKGTLQDFLDNHHLHGSVIISTMGKDGSIGEEKIEDLLKRVYKLDKVNERYEEFLEKYQGRGEADNFSLSFDYLSILADDPQLPFELLPDDWLGDKAYALFQKIKADYKTD